jgi:tRNA uracil 4-sulfurtransferase
MVKTSKMKKGIALLSGGIDSPVAIHLLKEKLEIIAVHFHQVELTGEQEIEKVKSLSKLLGIKKLYLVPFVSVFKELVEKCNHRDYYILSKIAMFQAAQEIAKKEGADFLITGENLAQVSSQTLINMKSITSQLDLTILRPLLTFDKQEIVDLGREIETYEISKGPEVCSLLGPSNPSTKSTIEKIEKELSKINLKESISSALALAQVNL